MKPISLTLRAFGPFCSSETISFEHIDAGHGLFLICGDTGSGKSTLLDAICFALFDDLPQDSSQRDAITLRSQHASEDQLTGVEFEFNLRGEHYRIIRSPTQDRPRKRGGGTTEQRSRAELVRLDGNRQIALADQPRKATQCIEELLGFSARQFRQIVVLPQGQFDRFLAAGSGDRETILAELFDSERYRRIEQALKATKTKLENTLAGVLANRKLVLSSVGAEDIESLEAQINETRQLHKTKNTELNDLKRKLDTCRTQLDEGQRINQLFEKKALAEQRVKAIDATVDEQKARVDALSLARAANALNDLWSDLQQRNTDQAQRVKSRDESALALKAAEQSLQLSTQRHLQALESNAEIDRLRLRQKELDSLKALTEDLPNLEKALKDAIKVQKSEHDSVSKFETQLSALEKSMDELRTSTDSADGQLNLAEVIKQKGLSLKNIIDHHDRLAETLNQIATTERTIEQLEAREASQTSALEKLTKQQTALETAFRQGQATLLARKLSAGDPCPVCGSVQHPHYAAATIDIPEKKDLDDIKARVEAENREVRNIDTTLAQNRQILKNCENNRAELENILQAQKDTPRSKLIAERDALRAEYEAARSRANELKLSSEKLTTLEEQAKALRLDLEAATLRLENATTSVTEQQTRYDERTQRLPSGLRSIKDFYNAQATTRKALDDMVDRLNTAETDKNNALTAFNHCQSQQKAAETILLEGEQQLTRLNETWIARRTGAGFVDDAAAVKSMRPDPAIKQLELEIQSYERDRNEASGELKSCLQECADLTPANIEQLQAAHQLADENWQSANRLCIDLENKLKNLEKCKITLGKSNEEEKRLEAQYSQAGKLSDVANGTNPLRLTLQRFVLGVLLDEVLAAANVRLAEMTKGRYALHRRSGSADGRRKGGLELDVFDEWTSDRRPVSTLSGGESFEAALALSLGLAEVSQNHAGGIQLDTLFIDEGFGSLDQDSLDRVMNTLTRLKESKRMVGIISHVNELKERIDVRLEVTTGPGGSKTRWTGLPLQAHPSLR